MQELYHGSRPEHRESIRREGLRPSPEDGYIFLTADPKYAAEHGGDVWRVNVDGLDAWESDPTFGHWIVDTAIGPERLTLDTEES